MMTELEHLRQTERWIANVRAGGVVFAVLQVVLSRLDLPRPRQLTLALGALAFDTAILSAYLLVYNFDSGSPIRQVLYLAVTEAAVRFGIVAPLLLTVATVPVLIEVERLSSIRGDHAFRTD